MGSVSSKGFSGEGKSPRRSWRSSGSGGTEPRPQRGRAAPSWVAGGGSGGGGVRRWVGGVVLTAVALALAAGFVYFVFVRPRATPLICWHVTDYEAPLAPQAYAQEDVDRFTQLFFSKGLFAGQVSSGPSRAIGPANVATADEFIESLVKRVREATPGGPDQVLLIYISAQGVVDAAGKPCLLAAAEPRVEKELPRAPTPSEVLADKRVVDLRKLLQALSAEHPRAWKVILLDAVRWDRNWRLGRAENAFADALVPMMSELSPTRDSDRIVLINSCSPGEFGLADPVQERTLFGDFVASGLAGEADQSRNGRIALAEFHNYLEQQIDAAAQRRGRSQRPQLILPGSSAQRIEFDIARTKRAQIAPRELTGDSAKRVTEFASRWTRLPAARSRGIPGPLITPLERARQELLRHEAVLLGGKAYKEVTEPDLPASWPSALVSPPPTVSLPLTLAAELDLDAMEASASQWASRYALPPPEQPDPVSRLAMHERLYGLEAALRQPGAKATLLFPRAGIDRTSVLPVELHASIRFHPDNPYVPAKYRAAGDSSRFLDNFLDCRQAAERAAYAGGDPRTAPWIAAAVELGDSQRRDAEDLLFAGGAEDEILQKLAAAQESYQQAAQSAAQVARAFALRDQVLSSLPAWLEWATVGDPTQNQSGADLIDAAQKLELLLDKPGDSQGSGDLSAAADKLAQILQKLEESVAGATDRCLASSSHLGILPQLEQLLSGPLADPARRARLWEKYFDVLLKDHVEPTAAPQPARQSAERAAAKRLLAKWLQSRSAASAKFEDLARSGRDELLQQEKDFDQAGEELRSRLAEADRSIRSIVPWLTLVQVRQPSGSDSVSGDRRGRHGAVLRGECARHDYYAWQAERFLQDFQGNDDGQYRELMTLLARDTLEPYFSGAAEQLLDSAEQLFPREQPHPARQQLADKRSAASALTRHFRQPLRPAAGGPTSPDAAEVTTVPKEADLAVQQLPAGQGALQLTGAEFQRDSGGVSILLDPPRDLPAPPNGGIGFPVPGPLAAASPPRVLPASLRFRLPAERSETPWKIAAYYRGHAGMLELQLDELKPGHVILAQRSPERGKLVVNSSLSEGTVVVVLDCSASMNDANRLWLKEAVQAVRKIVGQLLETRKIEVVLVLFAHRRGVPDAFSSTGETVLPWYGRFGGDQETVMFEDDYQTVWRGTVMDKDLRDILEAEPPVIHALGYTPLYSAVRHAAIDGFASNRRGSRQLVIISDGGDNIPLPLNSKMEPIEVETRPEWIRDRNYNSKSEKEKRANAARQAIDRLADVNVSLIYLAGLDGDRSPVEETKQLLKIPSDRTFEVSKKKAVAGARNVDALVASLAESVGIYPYEVVSDGGEPRPGSTAERLEFALHGRATVEWDDAVQAALEIVGDESLAAEIRQQEKLRRFYFLGGEDLDSDPAAQRVKLAAAEAERLTDSFYPTEYLIGCRAQQPKVGDKHRTFRVTLRHHEPGRFTPRPREVWVEIVPARPGSDGQSPIPIDDAEPYFFCQPSFVPDSPLPVLEMDAPNWPASAEAAVVRVWFRMTNSPQVMKLDENGLRRPNAAGFSAGSYAYSLDYLDDRKQWAIKVIETQQLSPGQPPTWGMVTLEGTPADEVERRFYPANGRVEHFFVFRDLQKEALGQRAVNIVPQSVWKGLATTAPKEFTVTIPRN